MNGLKKLVLTVIALVIAPQLFSQAGGVATESGKLQGVTQGQVESFKGVPFAAPPVGDLRWRAPQPVQPWSDVRQANSYSADCMQVPFPSDAAPLGTKPAEDCLYLNVWRPAGTKADAKLPVMFWIYGGGFVNGGSSPAVYDGSKFAEKGVVFISANYRLGRFGFFAFPELTKETRTAWSAITDSWTRSRHCSGSRRTSVDSAGMPPTSRSLASLQADSP